MKVSDKAPDYLQRILGARVYDVAIESPLDFAPNLSARLKNRVLIKREDLQPVFSFKLRGAYNKMVRLPDRKSTRLNSSHVSESRMPSSA